MGQSDRNNVILTYWLLPNSKGVLEPNKKEIKCNPNNMGISFSTKIGDTESYEVPSFDKNESFCPLKEAELFNNLLNDDEIFLKSIKIINLDTKKCDDTIEIESSCKVSELKSLSIIIELKK